MTIRYRADIDGLRAVAILAVVFCHAGFAGFSGGYVGVDVFFVISGFLITRVLMDREGGPRQSLLHFYDRRIRRLLPALAVVLLATSALALIVLPPAAMVAYAKSVAAAGLFSSNMWFWHVSGYFGPAAMAQPLLHTWSLGVEEQFYLLFPLAILLLDRATWRRMLVVLLIAGSAISLALAQYEVAKPATAAFFLLPTRAWELLAGSVLALSREVPHRTGLRMVLAMFGAALIALPLPFYDDATPFPGLAALPPILGAVLLIAVGEGARATWVHRFLASAPMVGVGRISYSLYLWHWPLLSLLRTRLGRDLSTQEGAVVVALSFVLAFLTWRYVETPARKDGFLGTRRHRFAAALAFVAVLVAGAGGAIAFRGIPGRVPASVLQAEAEAVSPTFLLRDKCTRGVAGFPADWCVLQPTGQAKGSIVVWGDSHAQQYYVAVASIMVPRGYTVLLASLGSCPPLPGQTVVLGSAASRAGQTCNRFNTHTLQTLRTMDGLRLVVLAGRWLPYIPVQSSGRSRWLATADGRPAGREDSVQMLYAGIEAAAAPIARRGVPMLLIDQVPSFAPPPPDCVIGARMAGRSDASCDQADKSQGARAQMRAVADRARAEIPGVTPYHPADALCSATRCTPVRDGHLLYRDGNHLGKAGIAYLTPQIERAIATAMQRHR